MKWNGKELRTIRDYDDAVYQIAKEGTRKDAENFMSLYSDESPYAYQNVGYLAGYHDQDTADRIFDWFKTSHPVFGRKYPTPEEALEAGRKMGEAIRDRNTQTL